MSDPRHVRIIPIDILSNPYTNNKRSSSNQVTGNNERLDITNNNNEYNTKLNNIVCSQNKDEGNSHRRSLLVTLEDGTTTETSGSIRDISSNRRILETQQNIGIEKVNGINGNQYINQQQQYSPLIHR